MLDNKQIQLISKLKQQPKIGSSPTALLDELGEILKKVFGAYKCGVITWQRKESRKKI